MMNDTMTTAAGLYGSGWRDLPGFARDAAADFVADLLDLTGVAVHDGETSDRVHECADAAVPIWRSELLALLADVDAADAILRAAEDLGGTTTLGAGADVVTGLVQVGVYGVLSDVFGLMVWGLERDGGVDGFRALGLDRDAAEVAAALLPEWSGTVRELLAAAPRLAADGVAVAR
jgi:hypothetical protein